MIGENDRVDIVATLQAPIGALQLFEVVADLSTYPRWLDIVSRSERAPADAGDPGPAWSIELRAQLGPLRRSKRLRMVRSRTERPDRVRFERRELDERRHSSWVLEADLTGTARPSVNASAPETQLAMRLHYGGSLWLPVLDRVLRDEIARSRPRLLEMARSGPEPS